MIWAIRKPDGGIHHRSTAACERTAWGNFGWDVCDRPTREWVEGMKSKGYRAVRLVDVDELREKVEGLEWACHRSSDNIDRSAVLELLEDESCK